MRQTFKLILIVVVVFTHQLSAQKKAFTIPDSLKGKTFDYIVDRIDEFEANKKKDSIYTNVYLNKAKAAKDYFELAAAYKCVMYRKDKKYWLAYSDSIVYASKQTLDNEEIGSAFLTKGIVWSNFLRRDKALENYLLADKYTSRTDNDYLIYKIKYAIGQVKYQLGYFEEAQSLQQECANYFRKEGGKPYLNTLYALALTYTRTGQFERCTETNKLGTSEAQKSGNYQLIPYFLQSEGINDYYKKDYNQAIAKLEKASPNLQLKQLNSKNRQDLANQTISAFYIGRSYWELNQKDRAIPYFKNVDDAFVKDGFIMVEFIEAYLSLINYYENKGQDDLLRGYLNRVVKAENIAYNESWNLARKVTREYDMRKIDEANKRLTQKLETERTLKIVLLIFSLIMSIAFAIIICRSIQKNRIRRQNFKEIMLRKDRTINPVLANKKIVDGDIEIKPEVVASVSAMLEKFEKSKKYLDNDLTLSKLALFVECNTTYTSKIILQTRGKKYNEYIDWLRINYIVDKLKTERKYRGYTIKALTEEAGFKSPQKFREAFKTNLDMTPQFFIKELEKMNIKNENI